MRSVLLETNPSNLGWYCRNRILIYVRQCGRQKARKLRVAMSAERNSHRAGVAPIGPHRLRQALATWSLRNWCDIETLSRLIGHSYQTVLQGYLLLVEGDLKAAHTQHSPTTKLGFLKSNRKHTKQPTTTDPPIDMATGGQACRFVVEAAGLHFGHRPPDCLCPRRFPVQEKFAGCDKIYYLVKLEW